MAMHSLAAVSGVSGDVMLQKIHRSLTNAALHWNEMGDSSLVSKVA